MIKKLFLCALGLVVILYVGAHLFKTQIGERMWTRALESRLSQNSLADLPDGLHVALLGTGSPMADPARGGPSTAIIVGNDIFMVDAGTGTIRNLALMGLPASRLDAVFLTHFHSDHIDGLGETGLQRWINGTFTSPLPLYGPQGVSEIAAGFEQAYGLDKTYRIAHHGADIAPPDGFGFSPQAINADSEKVVLTRGDLTITAFPVNHAPVEPALGYRFDYKDRSVTITGDTGPSERLNRAAQDTDLLVSDVLNPDMVGKMQDAFQELGAPHFAKIMADIPDYHMTPRDVAETAHITNTQHIVLTHIVPALPVKYLESYYTKGMSEIYSGPITVGEDRMLISLQAGTETIKITRP